MRLVFMITAHCNASCGHCSTSCGPQRTEALSRATVIRLIDEAVTAAEGEELEISITGGEPFLDFERLHAVIAHGTQRGAQMSCVTNGSWASSEERAVQLLTRLRDAGLTLMAVSASPFHQQFVKRSRVERALRVAREVGIECVLKYVYAQSDPRDEAAIVAWGTRAGAVRVDILQLAPHLREGEVLPEREYRREAGIPQGPCPAPTLNVGETGEAYTCCTPGAIRPFFSLGNTREAGMDELCDRFYLGGKQQILREHGPAYFARAIMQRGHGERLRAAYTGVCDLCTHIAADPVMAAIAEESALAFELQQIEGILDQAVGLAPAMP